MRYLLWFFCLLSLTASAQMSHEETVVRTAYAKFAYAVQQVPISELASEANSAPVKPDNLTNLTADQRLAAAQVNFLLQDFVVGDLRDILNRKVTDLISYPVGETLTTGSRVYNYDENGLETHWGSLEAQWRPAHVWSETVMAFTFQNVYEIWHKQRPDVVWQHYAAYSVTVTFQGKTRGPYKALFIFGHDDKGNEIAEPKDEITSIAGLTFALTQPLFPESFVLTRMRNFPVVKDWLEANQVSGPNCSASGTNGEICCDLERLKCGPKSEDVAAGLAKPLHQ
jgi:hypothetical protein